MLYGHRLKGCALNCCPPDLHMKNEDISHHIQGAYPLRVLDVSERDETRWLVCFHCGFEPLVVAVYGDGLCESDAEEAAIEWLQKIEWLGDDFDIETYQYQISVR